MRKPCREKRATKKAGAESKKLQDEMVVEDVAGIIHEEKGPGRSPPQPQATAAVLGSAKTCKQSWINDPRPALNRLNFGQDEEDLILKLHALLGNRWSLIAGRLPGRTDNQVENYWNYHLKRKLLSMGIDPNNHRIYHSTLPRRKNQIPEISDSDDSSSCATSAVSKSHKYYYGQNKIHVPNGTGNIELSKTFDRKSSDLPDLSLELAKINSNPHAAASSTSVIGAQEKKSAAISL